MPSRQVSRNALTCSGSRVMWSTLPSVTRERLAKGYIRVGSHTPSKPQKYVIQYLYSGKIRDIESGRATVAGRREDGSVIAFYESGKETMPTTQWNRAAHNAQTGGTIIVKRVLGGRSFPFPKSLYAVEDALRLLSALSLTPLLSISLQVPAPRPTP